MQDLIERTFNFAVNVIELLNTLDENRISRIIVTQLAKSATSVGTNYEESQGTLSKKEFYHKIGICLKEARESNFWLRIISTQNWASDIEKLDSALNESEELKLIFGKIFSQRTKS